MKKTTELLRSNRKIDEKVQRFRESKDINQEEPVDVYILHSGICHYNGLEKLLAILSQENKFVITKKTFDQLKIVRNNYGDEEKKNVDILKMCFLSNMSCFEYKDMSGKDETEIVKKESHEYGWIILTGDLDFAIDAKLDGCNVFYASEKEESEYKFDSILNSLDFRDKESEARLHES